MKHIHTLCGVQSWRNQPYQLLHLLINTNSSSLYQLLLKWSSIVKWSNVLETVHSTFRTHYTNWENPIFVSELHIPKTLPPLGYNSPTKSCCALRFLIKEIYYLIKLFHWLGKITNGNQRPIYEHVQGITEPLWVQKWSSLNFIIHYSLWKNNKKGVMMAQHRLILKLSTFRTQAWNVTSTQNRAAWIWDNIMYGLNMG